MRHVTFERGRLERRRASSGAPCVMYAATHICMYVTHVNASYHISETCHGHVCVGHVVVCHHITLEGTLTHFAGSLQTHAATYCNTLQRGSLQTPTHPPTHHSKHLSTHAPTHSRTLAPIHTRMHARTRVHACAHTQINS